MSANNRSTLFILAGAKPKGLPQMLQGIGSTRYGLGGLLDSTLIEKYSARLREAGFTADEIMTVPVEIEGEKTAGLVVRYAGRNAKAKPIAPATAPPGSSFSRIPGARTSCVSTWRRSAIRSSATASTG